LKNLGGQSGGTTTWVDDDVIAAHVLWLRDNRQVVPGDRFLVEGRRTRLHNNLPTMGKIPALVCEWLVKLLDATTEKRKGIEQQGMVLIGDGACLVNTLALSSNWEQFVTSDKTPSVSNLGHALNGISGGEKRIHGQRFHSVDVTLLRDWADRMMVGNPENIKALIDRTVTDSERAPIKRGMIKLVK